VRLTTDAACDESVGERAGRISNNKLVRFVQKGKGCDDEWRLWYVYGLAGDIEQNRTETELLRQTVVYDLYNQVVSIADASCASGFKSGFFFVMEYNTEEQMLFLVELEVRGVFGPKSQPAPVPVKGENPAVAIAARKDRLGKKCWRTVPEDRGVDLKVSALDCVVVDGAYAVQGCEDADDEEWHIPMSNVQIPTFAGNGSHSEQLKSGAAKSILKTTEAVLLSNGRTLKVEMQPPAAKRKAVAAKVRAGGVEKEEEDEKSDIKCDTPTEVLPKKKDRFGCGPLRVPSTPLLSAKGDKGRQRGLELSPQPAAAANAPYGPDEKFILWSVVQDGTYSETSVRAGRPRFMVESAGTVQKLEVLCSDATMALRPSDTRGGTNIANGESCSGNGGCLQVVKSQLTTKSSSGGAADKGRWDVLCRAVHHRLGLLQAPADADAVTDPDDSRVLTKCPEALVGFLVDIFWDGDQDWVSGEVLRYDEATRRHCVRYADGDIADEFVTEFRCRLTACQTPVRLTTDAACDESVGERAGRISNNKLVRFVQKGKGCDDEWRLWYVYGLAGGTSDRGARAGTGTNAAKQRPRDSVSQKAADEYFLTLDPEMQRAVLEGRDDERGRKEGAMLRRQQKLYRRLQESSVVEENKRHQYQHQPQFPSSPGAAGGSSDPCWETVCTNEVEMCSFIATLEHMTCTAAERVGAADPGALAVLGYDEGTLPYHSDYCRLRDK
jgi:hypothetical protein